MGASLTKATARLDLRLQREAKNIARLEYAYRALKAKVHDDAVKSIFDLSQSDLKRLKDRL